MVNCSNLIIQITDNEPGNGRERKNSQCTCHQAKYTNMEGSFKAWRPWERNYANEVIYNQPAEVDRHVDRLTDSVNMISNVQTTPWHWYSVQGLLK